ncbi:glycine zipper 2TM domain-containing protein [Parashewanella spongiae]|uniref:Glycine zipper 2TM domain-containing protein n=1 Tax=Parashewanella spongiae TaxID=342950 RepID=A0A3A6UI10_9GAMM|nr:glycine zipper 2TM domain-containing protein [Parashewanella spongiae]MCL1077230.1 glycine zipper 2TM domain-containing protein [Parashewanella spongiae]RJY18691.1 glycine zipper 2TM domain-containing protein [Parashewanella spongiae]
MLKPKMFTLLFLCLLTSITHATPYNRNKAEPVEKVIYGDIVSVRNITQKELVTDKNRGWKTFGGAILGGIVGNQFGKGSGRDIATVLGALAGGTIASQSNNQPRYKQYQLVELMIKQDDSQTVMIIQEKDSGMIFNSGDRVRVVYLIGRVRVDLAM